MKIPEYLKATIFFVVLGLIVIIGTIGALKSDRMLHKISADLKKQSSVVNSKSDDPYAHLTDEQAKEQIRLERQMDRDRRANLFDKVQSEYDRIIDQKLRTLRLNHEVVLEELEEKYTDPALRKAVLAELVADYEQRVQLTKESTLQRIHLKIINEDLRKRREDRK